MNNKETYNNFHISSLYFKMWMYGFIALSIFVIILYIFTDVSIPLDTNFMHFDPMQCQSHLSMQQVPPALFNFD